MASENKRVGIFISGSGWSGSSAVADWLVNSNQFLLMHPREINAICHGAIQILDIINREQTLGLDVAKRAMYPNSVEWKTLKLKGFLDKSWAYQAIDRVYTWLYLLFRRIFFGYWKSYVKNLNKALGKEYSEDKKYRELLVSFLNSCELYNKNRNQQDELNVNKDLSRLIAHFYHNRNQRGIPVFDNIFRREEITNYLRLQDESFEKIIVLIVVRDPRDQYARIVHYNYLPSLNLRKYKSEYLSFRETAENLVEMLEGTDRLCKIIKFEDFVMNKGNIREQLESEIEDLFGISANVEPPSGKFFQPVESIKNIGKWQMNLSKRQLKILESNLGEYFHPAADHGDKSYT